MGSGDRAGLEPRSAPYLLRFPSCEMLEILGLDLTGVLGIHGNHTAYSWVRPVSLKVGVHREAESGLWS